MRVKTHPVFNAKFNRQINYIHKTAMKSTQFLKNKISALNFSLQQNTLFQKPINLWLKREIVLIKYKEMSIIQCFKNHFKTKNNLSNINQKIIIN